MPLYGTDYAPIMLRYGTDHAPIMLRYGPKRHRTDSIMPRSCPETAPYRLDLLLGCTPETAPYR